MLSIYWGFQLTVIRPPDGIERGYDPPEITDKQLKVVGFAGVPADPGLPALPEFPNSP
jgi:hypothetical protein